MCLYSIPLKWRRGNKNMGLVHHKRGRCVTENSSTNNFLGTKAVERPLSGRKKKFSDIHTRLSCCCNIFFSSYQTDNATLCVSKSRYGGQWTHKKLADTLMSLPGIFLNCRSTVVLTYFSVMSQTL